MAPFRVAAAVAAVISLAAAEQAQVPPAVTKELEAYNARLAKIDQDAEKARTEERARMAKVFDEAMKAETKKGNLDLAVRLRDLRDGMLQTKPAPAAPVSGDSLLGDDEVAPKAPTQVQVAPAGQPGPMPPAMLQQAQQAIVGTWTMPHGQTWTVRPGGTFVRVREGGAEIPGTWRVGEGRIIFVYPNGREFPVLRVDARQLVLLREGGEFIGERVAR